MPNPIPGFAPSYNGVTFPVETETLGIGINPVYDEAGRTVIYNVYDITLKAELSDANIGQGVTTDNLMTLLRVLLTRPGCAFSYTNTGIGNLQVNVPGGAVKDVLWGPKPDLLGWKPNGGNLTVEVVWNVKVAIPDCQFAKFQFAWMEFNYKLEFDIDRSGYTTRKYSGHLRIPQTRRTPNDRTLSDNADAYREQLVPALVPKFRRIMGSFNLSLDKCRLDWSIVDEEMGPNNPPPGIIEVRADNTVDSLPGYNALAAGVWIGRINATYEVARNYHPHIAWKYFLQFMQDRLDFALKAKKGSPLVFHLSLKETEVYGKTFAQFSANYKILSPFSQILQASRLWQPILSDGTFAEWQKSMANTAFHPRGFSKLLFKNSDDAIVDLCAAGPEVLPKPVIIKPRIPFTTTPTPPKFKNPQPTAEGSWIVYKSRVRVEVTDNTIEMKPLPRTVTPPGELTGGSGQQNFLRTLPGQSIDIGSAVEGADSEDTPLLSPYGALSATQILPDVVQLRAGPSVYARLEGGALRAGWWVDAPTLLGIGDVPAIPMNRQGNGFTQEIAGIWYGVPIVAARWNLRYLLPSIPNGPIPFPPVPNMEIV